MVAGVVVVVVVVVVAAVVAYYIRRTVLQYELPANVLYNCISLLNSVVIYALFYC